MDKVFEGLKPELLWKHFDEIRKIPRCSGNEEKIREYIISFAKEKNLEYKVDDVGNIVIKKPATPGKENSPGVILQGHIDMVCEKNSDVDFDFSKDPIKVKREGEWITAEGTTLGADNGVGVAAALAILEDDSVSHGPLEALFTVDEERGLTGAGNIKPDFLEGRILLNLDSEDEGVFFIGCAGGGDTIYKIKLQKENRDKSLSFKIKVSGLKGGHSGVDIHLQRGNALKILGRVLYAINEIEELKISEVSGGDKHNAIPREAYSIITINSETPVKNSVEKVLSEVKNELKFSDPDVKIEYERVELPDEVYTGDSTRKIINSMMVLPHGVLAMSLAIKGLVESSTNLAVVKTENEHLKIVESSRSSINSFLSYYLKSMKAFGEILSAEVEQPASYPGWTPNPDSKILKIMKNVYKKLFGKDPEVMAIHAGLETGIIGEKFPGMDMISFGPTIKYPHSPDEKVHIESVEKFYTLLKETLKIL